LWLHVGHRHVTPRMSAIDSAPAKNYQSVTGPKAVIDGIS
jgi:hypothetical protein